MDKIENWLYFRTVTDEANDDGDTGSAGLQPGSICIPASSIQNMEPILDTGIKIHIKNIIVPEDPNSQLRRAFDAGEAADSIKLTVTQGKVKEVMQVIAQACNSYIHGTGFIVVADACVLTDSATTALNDQVIPAEFLSNDIDATVLTIGKIRRGRGIHEYYEIVTPMTADDNDVAASLSIKLPTKCVILEAALSGMAVATNNVGSVALEIHNAAVADDAASAGTEIVGADVTSNLSIPNADLDVSSDTGGNMVHSGTLAPIARGTDETFFHVCAKEDMSSMTGTPKVGVYLKWWGEEAVLL